MRPCFTITVAGGVPATTPICFPFSRGSSSDSMESRPLSGRLTVPYTTDSGTILSLPGLGRIEIYGCDNGSIVFAAQYHNTSTHAEDLWLQENDQSSGQSMTYQSVPAGGVVHLGGSYQTWHYSLLSVGSGTGKSAHAATAAVSAAWTLATHRCVFQAQATVQPGS